jgi:hypothetical protein
MAEVERCKLEEVDDETDFGDDKVRTSPKHNMGEGKNIPKDKVRAHIQCTPNPGILPAKQMPNVSNLQDPHDNPVDFNEDIVDCKWSWMQIGLSKCRMSVVMLIEAVVRGMVSVIDGWNNIE